MTDAQFNPSSFDPSMRDDLPGVLRYVLTKFLQNTDDMLPARVIAFDRAANRVSVQPLIQIVTTSNTYVPRAVLSSIPVLCLGAGGFVLSFPISPGDLGWIKANDRDISLFLQGLASGAPGLAPPNTARKHAFSDALFIPDTMLKGVTIAGGDTNNAVLQSLDGTVKVSLGTAVEIMPQLGVGAVPRAGAVIDAQSTSKALGVPAMTSSQKGSIPSPQLGFLVFDTTLDRLSVYTSLGWS